MANRIALLGVGLIGSSLGLAWKEKQPDLTIVGYDRSETVREVARDRGAVDLLAADPGSAVEKADLVVLAAPIPALLRLMEEIAPSLPDGALVTDVGSVKRPVMHQARAVLPSSVSFVGGHPMAGSEQSGPKHARADLFREAAYVLCPPDAGDAETLAERHPDLVELVEATGARIEIVEAKRHDRSVSTLSHLPQLLAVALANQSGADENAARLAGPGLRDMTRLAASQFDLWKSILIANQGFVLDALSQFSREIQQLSNRLAEENLDALEESFAEAYSARTHISHGPRDLPDASSDLYVEAQNRPGELFHITEALYEANLNVMDIEFLTVRSSTDGVFRIGFSEESTSETARQTLEDAGFTTRLPHG